MNQRFKVIRAETKVLDAETGRVHAVVSTEAKDRDGDIIRAAGWDLGDFNAHPVLLSSHNYMQLRSQIGEWEGMKVNGTDLEGVARYYIGKGNEEADWGFHLAEMGRAAYSVGFIPDIAKAEELSDGGLEFKGQKLLEASHVTIPSNPEALQAIKSLGLHPVLADIVGEALDDVRFTKDRDDDHEDEGTNDLQMASLDDLAHMGADLRKFIGEELERLIPGPIDYLALAGDEMKRHLEGN